MAYTVHLRRVNQTFYFRCRIPADLNGYFKGKEDVKRSLRTKCLASAKSLVKLWGAKTEQTFLMMRTGMLTTQQIRKLAEDWKHATLSSSEGYRNRGGGIPRNPDDYFAPMDLEPATKKGSHGRARSS